MGNEMKLHMAKSNDKGEEPHVPFDLNNIVFKKLWGRNRFNQVD